MANALTLPKTVQAAVENFVDLDAMRGRSLEVVDLLPVQVLRVISQDMQNCLQPCDHDQAVRFAQVLMGSYPNHKVADPETYTRAIVSVLAEHSKFVCSKAVDAITRTSEFLPSRAKVVAACRDVSQPLKEYQALAEAQMREHVRRERQAVVDYARALDREEFRKKHSDKSPTAVLADVMKNVGETKRK